MRLRIVSAAYKTWAVLEQEVDINQLPDATARLYLQLLRNFLVFMEVYRPGVPVDQMVSIFVIHKYYN